MTDSEKSNVKIRESSIELFRIISMLLVLIVHLNGWYLGDLDSNKVYDRISGINFKELYRFIVESASVVCVNCFILISGYFSIRPNFKSLYRLFTQILFFYVLAYGVACIYSGDSFSWRGMASCFFAFSRPNWFVQSYLMLVLFSPLLNAFIRITDRRRILVYTLIYFFVSFYLGVLWNCEYAGFHEGYSFANFILLYLLATCVRLYTEKLQYNRHFYIGCYIVCTLVITLMGLLNIPFTYYYNNPFVILSSLALFLYFRTYSFRNRVINWVASSAFAVFLFHTTSPFGEWLKTVDVYLFSTYSLGVYVMTVSCLIVGVFALSIVLDKLRMFLFECLYPSVWKYSVRFSSFFNKYYQK